MRTQKIFNGSTIAAACIGVTKNSHHSSIVAQYHHKRAILANGIISSSCSNTILMVVADVDFVVLFVGGEAVVFIIVGRDNTGLADAFIVFNVAGTFAVVINNT